MKNRQGFVHDIERSIDDDFLDEQEHAVLLRRAPSFELDPSEAERVLVERCVLRKVAIERFVSQQLRELVDIGSADGVLDDRTRALLQRHGRELFKNHDDPEAAVGQIIREELSSGDARAEAHVRDLISERLKEKATGNEISVEAYRALFQEIALELPRLDVDAQVRLMFECRKDLYIGLKESPPLADRSEDVEALPPTPPRPHFGLSPMLFVAVVSVVVAVLVFGGLMLINSLSGGATELDVIPPCQEGCEEQLSDAASALRAALQGGDLLGAGAASVRSRFRALRRSCGPVLRLPGQLRALAEEAYPAWTLCSDPVLKSASERLEKGFVESLAESAMRRAAATERCEQIALCLETLPESAACRKLERQEGCVGGAT